MGQCGPGCCRGRSPLSRVRFGGPSSRTPPPCSGSGPDFRGQTTKKRVELKSSQSDSRRSLLTKEAFQLGCGSAGPRTLGFAGPSARYTWLVPSLLVSHTHTHVGPWKRCLNMNEHHVRQATFPSRGMVRSSSTHLCILSLLQKPTVAPQTTLTLA